MGIVGSIVFFSGWETDWKILVEFWRTWIASVLSWETGEQLVVVTLQETTLSRARTQEWGEKPSCTSSGSYTRRQCLSGKCFCVDQWVFWQTFYAFSKTRLLANTADWLNCKVWDSMRQGDTELGLYINISHKDDQSDCNQHLGQQKQEPGCCLHPDNNGQPNCFPSGPDIPAFKSCPKTGKTHLQIYVLWFLPT